MNRINLSNFLAKGIIPVEIILLITLLYFRFQLGLSRYFDIDEFAHLHWGYNAYSGLRPYSDFLYFIPPVFLYITSLLFLFTTNASTAYTLARIGSYIIFLFLLLSLFLVSKSIRNTKVSIFALLILAFLPLPYDKFLEIRPDILATALSLLGLFFLSIGIKKGKKTTFFISGFFYALAIAVLPKVILFLPPVFIIFALNLFQNKIFKSSFLESDKGTINKKNIIFFLLGLVIPIGIVLGMYFASGNFSRALYLTTTFAKESARVLGIKFPMHSSLYFNPNDVYYAQHGVNINLVFNVLIYVFASMYAIAKLVSFLIRKTVMNAYVEFLIALTLFFNLYGYVKIFPLKHPQYIISFAPLIAFYFADLIYSIGRFMRKKKQELIFHISLFGIIVLVAFVGNRMYQVKKSWTNTKTISELNYVYNTIPKGEYVLDLFGMTLFFKDPYYVCCVPYGQYEEAFAFSLPSLEKALKKTETKYIYIEEEGRLGVLPFNHQQFIRDNYSIFSSYPMILAPGKIVLYELSGIEKGVELIASGYYDVFFDFVMIEGSQISDLLIIDGRKISTNPVYLEKGKHIIKVKHKGTLELKYSFDKRT